MLPANKHNNAQFQFCRRDWGRYCNSIGWKCVGGGGKGETCPNYCVSNLANKNYLRFGCCQYTKTPFDGHNPNLICNWKFIPATRQKATKYRRLRWKICENVNICIAANFSNICHFVCVFSPSSFHRSCRHCRREFHQSCHRKIVALFSPKLDPLSRLRKFPVGFWAFSFVAHYFSVFPVNWVIVSTFFPSFYSLSQHCSTAFFSRFCFAFRVVFYANCSRLVLFLFLDPLSLFRLPVQRQQHWPKKKSTKVLFFWELNPCHK